MYQPLVLEESSKPELEYIITLYRLPMLPTTLIGVRNATILEIPALAIIILLASATIGVNSENSDG
jgi:hypothetical protein